ncbi:MAG TPA: hypothetical protein VIL16_12435, partial [Trebonia sp.]
MRTFPVVSEIPANPSVFQVGCLRQYAFGGRAEDVDQLLAALASLRAHGPAWTYAAPEAEYLPDPDLRALPDWLASSADGPAAPCAGLVPAVLLLPEVVRLLAGEPLGLVAVQVAVAVILEVLVDLGRGEAGQHLLAELVVLDDAFALAVVL